MYLNLIEHLETMQPKTQRKDNQSRNSFETVKLEQFTAISKKMQKKSIKDYF